MTNDRATAEPTPLRPRDYLRLLFVAVHIFAIVVPAVPSPPGLLTHKKLQERGAKQAIRGLREALAIVGLKRSDAEVGEAVMATANTVIRAREAGAKPFAPYYRYAGTRQSWRMFSRVADRPARLEVHVADGDGWAPIYVALDPEHRWGARTLESERFRSMINNFAGKTNHRTYLGLVRWVGCQRLAEGHEGERLRVQLLRMVVPSPPTLRAQGGLTIREPYWVEERTVGADDCRSGHGAPSEAADDDDRNDDDPNHDDPDHDDPDDERAPKGGGSER